MDELGQKNPLGQSKHSLAPSKFDHVPGRHGDGIDAPGPQKNPLGQMMQWEEWFLAILSLKYPASHTVGDDVPAAGQNVPVGQGSHCITDDNPLAVE
jgi:hypothetical protein